MNDVDNQLLALRKIKSIGDGERHPHMGNDPDLAWAISMCREIADYAIRGHNARRRQAGRDPG